MASLSLDDVRLQPIYRTGEAARYLGVNAATLRNWVYGYERRFPDRPPVHKGPIITATGRRGGVAVPFIGLAEAMVLAAFREAGLPLQQIRIAVAVLRKEIGLEHALATQRLYSDGAKILYDFAEAYDDEDIGGLVVVGTGQRVFRPVIERYLERITFADADGVAARLVLPTTAEPLLEIDPLRSFGQPRFIHGGAPLASVVGRLRAGDDHDEVAQDFGLDPKELEDAVRSAA